MICAKGIEKNSGRLLHEIVAEALPDAACAILSGPSFAREVALGRPTAVTIAAEDGIAARLQASLSAPFFRPYASDDVTGVALGGAAKNVYAIACGVVEGMGLGENARAALLARSFAELARLGEALGAKPETLMGLSGLGDLVLTATSKSSRNFFFGVSLGQGKSLAELDAPGHPLAEGVATAPALVKRARSLKIELPIAEAMADLLSGKLPTVRSAHPVDEQEVEKRMNYLAVQDRTRDLVLGDAEEKGRQGRALERGAQPHRQEQHEGDEEGRSRLFLSHR